MIYVTDKPIRYTKPEMVFECLVCGLLFSSVRADAITCSSSCRVKGHRSGILEKLRLLASQSGDHVSLPAIARSRAILALRPDIASRIKDGETTYTDDLRSEVFRAYWDLLTEGGRT